MTVRNETCDQQLPVVAANVVPTLPQDENGASTGLENVAEFSVIVEDVNDNAPYLNMPNGLVWPENTPPGTSNSLRSFYTIQCCVSGILCLFDPGIRDR
jgi:hypothetical protein